LLNLARNSGIDFPQGWWCITDEFLADFHVAPLKWASASQPFIGDNCERVLIAGTLSMALEAFRCQVRGGTWNGDLFATSHFPEQFGLLFEKIAGIEACDCNTKITQGNIIWSANQHIFWFDIEVSDVITVGILQASGDLFYIKCNFGEGHTLAMRTEMAEGTIGSVFHDEVRGTAIVVFLAHFNAIVVQFDNVGVIQAFHKFGFGEKLRLLQAVQLLL
jgi:hypothetical protein